MVELKGFFDGILKQKQQRRAARWVTAHDEFQNVKKRHGRYSWQACMVRVLQSRCMQTFLTALLVLDVMAINTELFLDAEFPPCRFVLRDAIACCGDAAHEASYDGDGDPFKHSPPDLGIYEHESCRPNSQGVSPRLACDTHKWDLPHKIHESLVYFSIAVLTTFAIELFCLLVALDKYFFRNPLYVLDAFVISTALFLEIYLHSLRGQGGADLYQDYAGLFILSRFWRFLRVGHAIFASTSMASEPEVKQMAAELRQLEQEYSIALEKAALRA